MPWQTYLLTASLLVVAGWMLFDGARALVVGDYVTPSAGEHAGQLGPWAPLVERVGIEPRSTLMMGSFMVFGLAGCGVAGALLVGWSGARWAVVGFALATLWYLPFGTLLALLDLALVAWAWRLLP